MALQRSLLELTVRLQELRDSVTAVRITVEEDRPIDSQVAVVDRLEDVVEDMFGLLQEAIKHSMDAQGVLDREPSLQQTRDHLEKAQEAFQNAERCYDADLVSATRQSELMRLARERLGAWLPWAKTVAQELDNCRAPLEGVRSALARCWEDLSESSR